MVITNTVRMSPDSDATGYSESFLCGSLLEHIARIVDLLCASGPPSGRRAAAQVYLHANLKLKEQLLQRTSMPKGTPGRYRPDDQLLAFLTNL
jgi:hypothetical protein